VFTCKPPLLKQFQEFCTQNRPEDMQNALEFFAVFGGLGIKVDTSKPLIDSIEEHILDEYDYIHSTIIEKTAGDTIYHSVLTGLSVGDSQAHTAFKRAKVSAEDGPKILKQLSDMDLITVEPSREQSNSWIDESSVSDRYHFNRPYLRFWFAFVSPIFKGIREGDYREFEERFNNKKQDFFSDMFILMSQVMLKESFKEDKIIEMGSYWDKNIKLDIYAKTASGKTVAGNCKYTNSKIKKNELNRLKETASNHKTDIYVLVSKAGFSNELKALKGDNLKLFTLRNLKSLII